jgi:hypothetical protein
MRPAIAFLISLLALPAASVLAREAPPPISVGKPRGEPSKAEKAEAEEEDKEPERLPEGMRIREGDIIEVYVDAKGKIYKERRYQGVVPRFQDEAAFSEAIKTQLRGGKQAKVVWVGFQKLLAASRVFIKTDRVVVYTLYKPNPAQIVVEFPRATVPLRNNMRELTTSAFDTPVSRIRVHEDPKRQTVQVLIDLRPPVSYIYRQDGPYIYVDIER